MNHDNQRTACFSAVHTSASDTVVAIRKRRPQCYTFARSLGGTFTAMEEMDCSALRSACRTIESRRGLRRVAATIRFASQCLTGITNTLRLAERIKRIEDISTAFHAHADLISHVSGIARSDCMLPVSGLLKALSDNNVTKNYRRELWDEMNSALDAYIRGGFDTLSEAAWARPKPQSSSRQTGVSEVHFNPTSYQRSRIRPCNCAKCR